jgi:hypothetical protein
MPYQGGDVPPLNIVPKAEPAITTNEPFGCHLQSINGVGGSLTTPAMKAAFDALLKQNHGQGNGYKGQYFTGTIVSFATNCPSFKATVEALKERGFKHLGTQKGAHGTYKMVLYGLGFELPSEEKK